MIATRLKWYLGKQHVQYECILHPHSKSSLESARRAHVAEGRVAKCVLLEDERGYVTAVLPANQQIDLDHLRHLLSRELELASEAELGSIFFDCELGAIPGLTKPYNIPMVIEESLLEHEVYVESGDHETLVHLSRQDFALLTADATAAHFATAY
jgi:Ala-tRNA(Pro) deacylase